MTPLHPAPVACSCHRFLALDYADDGGVPALVDVDYEEMLLVSVTLLGQQGRVCLASN